MALLRAVVALALCLGIAACGQSPNAGAPPVPTLASASASGPTKQDWCAAYSELTTTLASAAPDPTGASAALTSLAQFDTLWAAAEGVGILDAEEVGANRRAVASYRVVLEAEAKGFGTSSAEMTAARDGLTSQTEKDRTLLTSSADKVLAACGAVTETPAP